MVANTEIDQQKRERIDLGFILFLALLFYAVFIYRTAFSIKGETYFTLVDDAMISMRYAKNLSNGFGFVWNIGEPPVEGFTNLGWTLYMAILHTTGISESKISLLMMITSAFILLGNAFLSFKISKIIAPESKIAPLIAAIITAFYYPLVFWSLRGMEVGIATLLVYMSVLLAINPSKPIETKRALFLGLVMLLAIVVRFDVVLQITLIVGYVLYDHIIKKKAKFILISPILLFYLAGIISVLLFQYLYFGSVFPNTYYLKVVGVSFLERFSVGIQVFVEYATRDFLAPLFIIIAGFICFPTLREKRNFLLLALFFIQCGYSIFVGGDYAEPLNSPQVEAANRFITQGMPSVIILFSIIIDCFLQAIKVKNGTKHKYSLSSTLVLASGISLAAIVIMSGAPWFKWMLYNAPLLNDDISGTELGIHIRDNTDQNVVIAVHSAGQIPYYSNRRTIDLLGVNDPVIAKGPPATSLFRPGHNKWNYEYSIMTLKPDLVADEWGQLAEFLADKPDWYRLANGIWIRKDSTHINIEGLEQEYR
ncbi:MAG: hypothetical protein ABSA51_06440 [Anaerolineaceae bacterium]|jgi:hypothetical protein